MGSGIDWRESIDRLSQKFYCVAVDLPGHGRTQVHGSINDYTMDSFSRTFAVFVKKLNLQKSVLVGYSMGGRFALFLSVYFNSLWSAAIFESTTPGLRQEKQRLERRAKDAKLIKKLKKESLETFLKAWYKQPLFESILKVKKFDLILKQRLNNDPEELIKSLKMMGVGEQPSLWNACGKINFPVLLLAGEFDRKFCNIIRDMKSVNQDFQVKIIDKAGHNVHVEQPEAYLQQVLQFLNSNRESLS
jgi:2-succinyl-6-hydroxy-2,4-cyclohexadiene-1-carboxylate synthase